MKRINSFTLTVILFSLCYSAAASVISPTNDVDELLEYLGFNSFSGLSVTGVELGYGDGNGKIYHDPGAVINSSPFIKGIVGVGDELTIVSTAASGKKTLPSYVPPVSIGTYEELNGTYSMPDAGIILSTGNVSHYENGLNTTGSKTTAWGNSATSDQNALLSQVTGAGREHYDVTQLDITFDIESNVTDFSFLASFGSEEYSSYTNTAFNDGFGMFLNGTNIAGTVPTGETDAFSINIAHPDMDAISGTQLDGVINPVSGTALRFSSQLTGGSTDNVLSIIIGDRADQLYDSSVFLKLDDVNSSTPPPSTNDPITPIGRDVLFNNGLVSIASSGKKYKSTGATFEQIFMPSLNYVNDPNGYQLWIWNGVKFAFQQDVFANQAIDLAALIPGGVKEFMILGIDPVSGIDLRDHRSFSIGAIFSGEIDSSDLSVSIVDVSAPSAIMFFVIGIFWLNFRRHKAYLKLNFQLYGSVIIRKQ